MVQALLRLETSSGLVQARFRLGSGWIQVLLRSLVQAGFSFWVLACFRPRSDLRLLRAWFRLGSGLVQARFRLGSGFAQVWLRGLVKVGLRFP